MGEKTCLSFVCTVWLSECILPVSKVAGWMEEKIRPDMIVTLYTLNVCVWWQSVEHTAKAEYQQDLVLSKMTKPRYKLNTGDTENC